MIQKFGSSFAVSAAGAAVALGLLLSTAAPVASAAGLTEPQIQSILSLLSSFGAEGSVISNVDASLHGRPMMPPMHMGSTTMPHIGSTTNDRDDHQGKDDRKDTPPFGMPGMGSTTASTTMWHAGSNDGHNWNDGRPSMMWTTTASSSMPCPNITMTLSEGNNDTNTGGQVKQLQRFLTQHLNLQDNIVTGFFGPKTAEHLKEFQGEQGLDQAGRVGGLTRAALAHMCGGLGHMMDNHGNGGHGDDHASTTASTTVNH